MSLFSPQWYWRPTVLGTRHRVPSAPYLEHLRAIFHIPRQTGDKDRPWGLADYQEEHVWQLWNQWLSRQGKKITAQPSRRKYRYINYPLSQTLLRDGDCNWLARRFWEEVRHGSLSRTYDSEMLFGWMQAHRSKFPRSRLWQVLDHPEQQLRYEATLAAIFDVYSSVDWDAEMVEDESGHAEHPVRWLTAGLYREEDPFTGDVTYSIYMRNPKNRTAKGSSCLWGS